MRDEGGEGRRGEERGSKDKREGAVEQRQKVERRVPRAGEEEGVSV